MNDFPRASFTHWREGSPEISLITAEELATLADGTVLRCINGNDITVGVDKIDDDTRGGFLAYGFLASTEPQVADLDT